MDEDLRILVRVLFSNVEWRKVEVGIAVRPVNQPAAERIVEMSVLLYNAKFLKEKLKIY